MFKSTSIKSLPLAAAVAAAMMFGAAVHAQTPSTSSPMPAKNQSDNVAPQPTGATAKSAEQRTEEKDMKKNTKAARKATRQAKRDTTAAAAGTNSTASKTGDQALPMNKGEGAK